MFYFIKGTVAQVEPSLVVLDANGVGYGVRTSMTSASQVKTGDKATFYTYLYVREDIFDLYGFASREELQCFQQLIAISGVGPKAACAILSAVTPGKLALAVIADDEKALCAAPGIGKKLAQRILLELKDKMAKGQLEAASFAGADAPAVSMGANPAYDDAVAALAVLGYPRSQIVTALSGVDTSAMQTDDIVRAALKKLF
ncbi:MAG: Holliday junction DNA helicase RuvA [Clostridium sp. SCN 57-10]|nr:MAG: Holliday junction DNA helicase RuvA [Clostridium sp. SCN 57-10]